MPPQKNNILPFNKYLKSDEMLYVISADLDYLIKKVDGCANSPEKCLAVKIVEHVLCGYSMSAIWAFDNHENKYNFYREKDCMKTFGSSLLKHATDIISFK